MHNIAHKHRAVTAVEKVLFVPRNVELSHAVIDKLALAYGGCPSLGGERELDGVNNQQESPPELDDRRGEGGLRLRLVPAAALGEKLGGEPAR